jgi:alcohol dehydrogenase
MAYKFYMPTLSLLGAGALEDTIKEIKDMALKKALIVTDKVLVSVGLVTKLTLLLEDNAINYVIYDETQPNPTVQNVEDGEKILHQENCDFVISFGGGSPHDCAKGIALVGANGGSIKDYEGVNQSKKPQVPLIAINTTAGTASEMTIFCIITDEQRHVKMAIVDKNTCPIIAVNDPNLMMDMPKSLTAATGMDALTHAIEAYVSTAATPVTDACALQAVKIISKHLKTAVIDGQNEEARSQMAYAEFLAGMAFNNASLGYVHAMAHQLGGFYDLPHGVCNAILLPHVQSFNKKVASRQLKELAEAMGGDITNLSDDEGADLLLDIIKKLSTSIDIPSGLRDLEVKEEDFSTLADNALKDACSLTNPVQGTKEDVIQIFKNAF